MASVILTVAGTAIGGPVGGLIGALAGRSIDRAIFGGGASSRTIEGRRLTELSVQTSSYGEPVNRVYGTMRLPGNVIWSSGLVEKRNEATAGSGGKGGQRVTTVTYSYSVSFAVALSGREIADIGRVWADGKLLRDATGKLAVAGEMRIYNGAALQNPDPAIEAIEGQGNVNGFHNLAYVVFEGLELAEYANRIPNLTFEVIGDTGGDISLSDLMAEICDLAQVRNYDTSDLDQRVSGYMIQGPASPRQVIEELAEIYQFDVVEQENSLLFRKLGRISSLILPSDDLVAARGKSADGQKIILTRQQEMELPREVGLSYIDPARNYQAGLQRARRVNIASDLVRNTGYPLVLSSSAAKTISEVQLDLAWYGREQAAFTLPPRYADLAPGDIVTLTVAQEGQDYLLLEMEYSPEGIACKAVKFSKSVFVRTALGDSGTVPSQQVENLATSQFYPLDMPSLTGEGGTVPLLFWAVGRGQSGKWQGAGLLISRDQGVSYTQIDYVAADVVSGVVDEALGAGPANFWDRGNDILVRLDLVDHSLSGATTAAVLNGANICWLGGELIQFSQADQQPDGRYLLSGLLRGRRGTEDRVTGHGPAERFILLTPATVAAAALNMTDIGRDALYKAVTTSGKVEDVTGQSFTYGAAILRPFTPVHVRATRDGSGAITLRWIRRSRVGGDWMDGADVPLGELYEKYDIEIIDGGSPVRILASDNAEVIYSAALQISDFGNLQPSLTVRISQISDLMGRGDSTTVTI